MSEDQSKQRSQTEYKSPSPPVGRARARCTTNTITVDSPPEPPNLPPQRSQTTTTPYTPHNYTPSAPVLATSVSTTTSDKGPRTPRTPAYKTSVFSNAATLNGDAVNEGMTREIESFLSEWESKMSEWEQLGEWIEVRETVNGRVAWYNSLTTRLVFDTPPNVEVIALDEDVCDADSKYYLNRSLQPLANEDVVARLLQFDRDDWNFDFENANVYAYRLAASQRDHSSMLCAPQQYVFPEYFSLAPLPSLLANKFLAKIKLPSELSKNKKYSLVQIQNETTTAFDVIRAGVTKLDPPHNKRENCEDFIIKIVGQEAYMYGNKHVIEYEAVRDALRNEDDVEFALIKRTDFKSLIESAAEAQKEYCHAFESAYDEILSRSTLCTIEEEDDTADDTDTLRTLNLPTDSISLYEFDWHYRLKIEGLSNVTCLPRYDASLVKSVYVAAEVWCGGTIVSAATLSTSAVAAATNKLRWAQWLSAKKLLFSQLPREATLCLIVYGNLRHTQTKSEVSTRSKLFGIKKSKIEEETTCRIIPLAWTRFPLIQQDGKLVRGQLLLNMWHLPSLNTTQHHENEAHPYQNRSFRYRGSFVDRNVKASRLDLETQCQLLIAFDRHSFDVIAPQYCEIHSRGRFTDSRSRIAIHGRRLGNATVPVVTKKKMNLESIINKSPLTPLSIEEKEWIWSRRESLWKRSDALSAFVRSVTWSDLSCIVEAHKYILIWCAPQVHACAIEFLDYKYCDSLLRSRAVDWLSAMDDSDLQKYLLQLIQCLKFELYDDSPLSQFLIRRAIKSPYQIGHYFFWHLKCESEQFIEIRERFGLYLEEYLLFSSGHKNELFVEFALLKRLEWISKKVTAVPEKKRFSDESKRFFKHELIKLNRDLCNKIMSIPLYPRWRALRIRVEECKYMSSKKVPLWLVFENADRLGSDIVVMYKYGDDLRQDMLTLQIISLMDNLWLNRNLDLHLKPYKCLSTGYNSGMLEIVLNSKTVNNIAEAHGGVFNERAIDNFIKQYNISPSFQLKAKETFARSVAGYCIATYVLGISDRHSSNYMVCKNGQFFHIDFGHFLGNWKTKWGIKRERTPLVFTNQMRYAIEHANDTLYKQFISWCSRSYNILREQNRLLLILFRLMIAAGIPELVNINDIMYFQNALNLNMDNKSATKHIEKAIDKALKDWGTYVNNKFHQIRHQNKK